MFLDNNEIEVSCDVLWFMKTDGTMDDGQQRLFDRLQTIRVGDYGGTASTKVVADEIAVVTPGRCPRRRPTT